MKKLICTIFLLSGLSASVWAQQGTQKEKNTTCKKTFLGIQTGINNHNGIIGLSLEQALAPQWTIGAGIGTGSWGTKVFAEGRYYFHDACYSRTALGMAFTYAPGFSGLSLNDVPTNYGDVDVKLIGDPVANLGLSFYRFWSLGRKKSSKFYITFGYSIRLNDLQYRLGQETLARYPGIRMTDDAERAVRFIAPGGLIVGLGFYFGL